MKKKMKNSRVSKVKTCKPNEKTHQGQNKKDLQDQKKTKIT